MHKKLKHIESEANARTRLTASLLTKPLCEYVATWYNDGMKPTVTQPLCRRPLSH